MDDLAKLTDPGGVTVLCPDCGRAVAAEHEDGCDVARCLVTGLQRLSCGEDHDCGRDVWTGKWPSGRPQPEAAIGARDREELAALRPVLDAARATLQVTGSDSPGSPISRLRAAVAAYDARGRRAT